MIIRVAFTLLLAIALAIPAATQDDPTLFVAAAMSGLQVAGTVYKAGGIVRTAKHVVDTGHDGVGLPDRVYPSRVLCDDAITDTAFLETSAQMPDLPVGLPPELGSQVIAVGFRLGRQPPIAAITSVMGYLLSVVNENGKTVGPVMILTFYGVARGMSGGPILRDGKAVGTIVLYNGTYIFAVPIRYAKCTTKEGR